MIRKIFDLVLGSSDEVDEDFLKRRSNVKHTLSEDNTPQRTEHKEVIGIVTSLHGNYCLVDGEIYVHQSSLVGGCMPQVNDKLHVKASRHGREGGWTASAASLITDCNDAESWEEDCSSSHPPDSSDDASKSELTVAMVVNVTNDTVFVDSGHTFSCSDILCDNYKPKKRDWISMKITASDSLQIVSDVKPLRIKNFENEVVNVALDTHGYLEGDIYYSVDVCEEGFVPKRGQRVRGTAVESEQGKCNWRAYFVAPAAQNQVAAMPRAVNLQSPMMQSNTEKLMAEKMGIQVRPRSSIDFGRVQLNSPRVLTLIVRNTAPEERTLSKCYVRSSSTSVQFVVSPVIKDSPLMTSVLAGRGRGKRKICQENAVNISLPLVIEPQTSVEIGITCLASQLGVDKQMVILDFTSFKIGRSSSSLKLPNRLPNFAIPEGLSECVLSDGATGLIDLLPCLSEPLKLDNYAERFSGLIHLEEIQQQSDIRQFDLDSVALKRYGEFLALEVPGLAEGRPSLLIGDRVILSNPAILYEGPEYEGFIHEVLKDQVLLKFHDDFHDSYLNEDYNVRFTFSRTTYRRCHQAVKFGQNLGEEVLFPSSLSPKASQILPRRAAKGGMAVRGHKPERHLSPASLKMAAVMSSVVWNNPHLNNNQRVAVQRIMGGHCRPTPYILFGPPGTGKTMTVVEAILQVFTRLPSSRIIACTPSNSAADLITERLHLSGRIQQCDMIRLNAFQRSEQSIVASILPYCDDGTNLDKVAHYRIIISTCASAGSFYALNLKPGHFTHAFIDEAGQATEPECLIPIGLVACHSEGQVVLAGDPMQLGPVLSSRYAIKFGLGLSFLERLINLPLYLRDEKKFAGHGNYDPFLVTKLVENYRSHPALLAVPSCLFYHDELQVSADRSVIECMCQWEKLPNSHGFPFIFHGIRGEDLREGNSPSWFNPMEAVQVMSYLQSLITNTCHPLTWDDIGVITPYRKQVEKIRILIDRLGLDKVKVGSVEEFQGQERLVIIISTVRSCENLVSSDVRHHLGFLSNPKRFNVSVTRSQALLIVIGNPHILVQDDYWREIIQYCVSNRAYVGCDLPISISVPDDPLAPNDLLTPYDPLALPETDASKPSGTSSTNQSSRGSLKEPGINTSHDEITADSIVKGKNVDISKSLVEPVSKYSEDISKSIVEKASENSDDVSTRSKESTNEGSRDDICKTSDGLACENSYDLCNRSQKPVTESSCDNLGLTSQEDTCVMIPDISPEIELEKIAGCSVLSSKIESKPAVCETANKTDVMMCSDDFSAQELMLMSNQTNVLINPKDPSSKVCRLDENEGDVEHCLMEQVVITEANIKSSADEPAFLSRETTELEPEVPVCNTAVSELSSNESSAEDSSAVEPSAVELSAEEPSAVELSAVESSADSSGIEPSAVEPSAVEPSGIEPSAVEPSAVEPSAVEPSGVESSAVEPSAEELSAVESSAVEPSSIEPSAIESPAVEPSAAESSAVQSSAVQSSAVEPSSIEPSAVEPSAVEPSAAEPLAAESSAVPSSAVEPSAVEPSAVESSAVEASAVEPLATEPLASEFFSARSSSSELSPSAETYKSTHSDKVDVFRSANQSKADLTTKTVTNLYRTQPSDNIASPVLSGTNDVFTSSDQDEKTASLSSTDTSLIHESNVIAKATDVVDHPMQLPSAASDGSHEITSSVLALSDNLSNVLPVSSTDDLDNGSVIASISNHQGSESSHFQKAKNAVDTTCDEQPYTGDRDDDDAAYVKSKSRSSAPPTDESSSKVNRNLGVLESSGDSASKDEQVFDTKGNIAQGNLQVTFRTNENSSSGNTGEFRQVLYKPHGSQRSSASLVTPSRNLPSQGTHSGERSAPLKHLDLKRNSDPWKSTDSGKTTNHHKSNHPRKKSDHPKSTDTWKNKDPHHAPKSRKSHASRLSPQIDKMHLSSESTVKSQLDERKHKAVGPELENAIVQQIEYYFGDFNLMKDTFLLEAMSKDPDNWVPLSLLMTFNRMRSLTTSKRDVSLVLKNAESDIFECRDDGDAIRRSRAKPLVSDPTAWKAGLAKRSVVVEQPRRCSLEEMQVFFKTYGRVEHLEKNIKRAKSGQRKQADEFMLVVFFITHAAQRLANVRPLCFRHIKLFSYYRCPVVEDCIEYMYERRILNKHPDPVSLSGGKQQSKTKQEVDELLNKADNIEYTRLNKSGSHAANVHPFVSRGFLSKEMDIKYEPDPDHQISSSKIHTSHEVKVKSTEPTVSKSAPDISTASSKPSDLRITSSLTDTHTYLSPNSVGRGNPKNWVSPSADSKPKCQKMLLYPLTAGCGRGSNLKRPTVNFGADGDKTMLTAFAKNPSSSEIRTTSMENMKVVETELCTSVSQSNSRGKSPDTIVKTSPNQSKMPSSTGLGKTSREEVKAVESELFSVTTALRQTSSGGDCHENPKHYEDSSYELISLSTDTDASLLKDSSLIEKPQLVPPSYFSTGASLVPHKQADKSTLQILPSSTSYDDDTKSDSTSAASFSEDPENSRVDATHMTHYDMEYNSIVHDSYSSAYTMMYDDDVYADDFYRTDLEQVEGDVIVELSDYEDDEDEASDSTALV